jgi:hypothetical protein
LGIWMRRGTEERSASTLPIPLCLSCRSVNLTVLDDRSARVPARKGKKNHGTVVFVP